MEKLFFIFDSKGNFYGTPIVAVDDALALRLFDRLALAAQGDVASYPEDFSLYCCYDFNPSDASVSNFTHRLVSSAIDRQLYYKVLAERRQKSVEVISSAIDEKDDEKDNSDV